MHIHRKTESILISRKDRQNETEVNSAHFFLSIFVGKSYGLLTRNRNQRYRLTKLKNLLTQKLTFRLLLAFS